MKKYVVEPERKIEVVDFYRKFWQKMTFLCEVCYHPKIHNWRLI